MESGREELDTQSLMPLTQAKIRSLPSNFRLLLRSYLRSGTRTSPRGMASYFGTVESSSAHPDAYRAISLIATALRDSRREMSSGVMQSTPFSWVSVSLKPANPSPISKRINPADGDNMELRRVAAALRDSAGPGYHEKPVARFTTCREQLFQ